MTAATISTRTFDAHVKPEASRPGLWQRLRLDIEAHGRRRAAIELGRLAAYRAVTDPELVQLLRDAGEPK
jgi:hypothetical protein